MSLTVVAVTALLPSSAQDGHWSGKLEGDSKAAKVSFDVTRCGGRDEWRARRTSR